MLKRIDVIAGYTRCLPVANTPAFILIKDRCELRVFIFTSTSCQVLSADGARLTDPTHFPWP